MPKLFLNEPKALPYANLPQCHNYGCLQGKRVLELGAGLGAVGMSLAKKGASVVLTDKPEVMALMRRNVQENFAEAEIGDRVQVWTTSDAGERHAFTLFKRVKRG